MTVQAMISIIALAAQAVSTATPADAPYCGSRDRDIGQGFHLTQYMNDGRPDFTLDYRPAAGSIVTHAAEETATFRLVFRQLAFEPWTGGESDFAGPRLGYRDFEFRKPDGARIWPRTTALDCGGGVRLTTTASNAVAPVLTGPMTFPEPFFRQRVAQCVEEIRQDGRIKMIVSEGDLDAAAVVIEDHVPLRWAIAEAERLWRADTARAEQGVCRIMPSPPPIPVLPPPPPPKTGGG